MTTTEIIVRGAREHNLRDVNLKLPRGNLICFTGVSGSGKSSLAFDTLYAEGQRRYVESLSNYARQFMGQMPKPDVDLISGLSPSISISQKSTGNNPRSTVGTITEINDFLRVLFARVGTGHCPHCGTEISAQTRDTILGRLQALPSDATLTVLAPLIRKQKGEFRDLFEDLRRQGYGRARVDGEVITLADPPRLDRQRRHDVEAVIDRLPPQIRDRGRLAEAVDSGLRLGDGVLIANLDEGASDPDAAHQEGHDILCSSHYACSDCGRSYSSPTPQLFSFNSPQGMCPSCDGLGHLYTFVPELLIPNDKVSIRKGAVSLLGKWGDIGRYRRHIYTGVGKWIDQAFELDEDTALTTAWRDLPEEVQQIWLWGTEESIAFTWRGGRRATKYHGEFDGLIPELLSRYRSSKNKMQLRQLEKYMDTMPCPDCHGARLNAQARAVTITTEHAAFEQPTLSLPQVSEMPIDRLAAFFEHVELSETSQFIAGEVLKEIRTRLGFLLGVGLDYLSLARTAPTLSGGESQRIRLAGQIGSGLVGVLYILDEPSIGLHPRDNDRLIKTLLRLRDAGNTLIVVEHDEDTMRAADMLVDFGPGPGVKGGQVVASGDCETVAANKKSVTGRFLAGTEQIEIPPQLRPVGERQITIRGATHHNLKGIDVSLPIGTLCCVTGVSGSGKSSLIGDILEPALRNRLNGAECEPGAHDGIDGIEHLDKTITIDQTPIGRTPRSNPATYVKVFDEIRNLFARLPEAKTRGYTAGRFSFNVEGGRCSACDGNGANKLEMDFMADVWVVCPVCEGKRYNRETLAVHFKGHSIADVLQLDISQAMKLFKNVPKIATKLQTLVDVGLEYLKLGQPSPTLSGGEAQRIKLSRELSKKATGRTLYILDEPTTGLHFADIRLLLNVLHGLVDLGNTVLVVEHNQDVIKTADWVVDLGPEGGEGGGRVVAVGTPAEIAAHPDSYTGRALAKVMGINRPDDPLESKLTAATPRQLMPPADLKEITVEGASQHNLKSVDVKVPRDAMTVFCGPSGSGKSSLAMHTIYAEGQRRYVESLSSYARQFIGQVQKPKAERIEGLSPAVALEQKNLGHSPRSTVGTVTEIYDYFRILMARLGTMYCPDCQIPVGTQTSDQIVEKVLAMPEGTRLLLLAPITHDPGQDPQEHWESLRKNGFARIRVDGVTYPLDKPPELDVRRTHRLQVVVDRLVIREEERSRIADSVELALGIGAGVIRVAIADKDREENQWTEIKHSQHLACESCGRSFSQLTPHHFSFNSMVGWCPQCEGLGTQTGTNPAALLRDPGATLADGAALLWPDLKHTVARWMLHAFSRRTGVPLDQPIGQMSVVHRRMLYHGTGERWFDVRQSDASSGVDQRSVGESAGEPSKPHDSAAKPTEGESDAQESSVETDSSPVLFRYQFKGFYPALEQAARLSPRLRGKLEQFVDEIDCSACSGTRLREEAASVRFKNHTIGDFVQMPLDRLAETVGSWKLDRREKKIAGELIREIKHRTTFLLDVGLDYLTIGRPAATLSGGEAQRIRLAAQLGSGLCGVLYVLDEPTIGLHPRDNHRLLGALHRLRDLGNTLLVVEHDHDVIAGSDHLCDFGPGAGRYGGRIVAQGPPTDLQPIEASVTAPYIDGSHGIPYPANRRPVKMRDPLAEPPAPTRHGRDSSEPVITVRGAREHNLRDVTVSFPLGALIAVTGPSGSGKSSLVDDILYPHLARTLHRARLRAGRYDAIDGLRHIDKVIQVDQSPLGNTPSSNPATYTGVFDLIRTLFSRLPESQERRYTPRVFSFNVDGGRCDACEGSGQRRIEMHFLPDVWVPCEACGGLRYKKEILEVKLHAHSIADVLNLPCGEALRLFKDHPKIVRVLQTICDVGLEYVTLGQSAPTLSGGEAQRVKLAAELARPDTGRTLYLLDEPTTGLHFDDIKKLLAVLQRLVDAGNTVVVIEHNLDVIKCADWIIDMGPEAGAGGGNVVVSGSPEQVAAYGVAAKKKQRGRVKKNEKRPMRSYTGEFLDEVLRRTPAEIRSTSSTAADGPASNAGSKQVSGQPSEANGTEHPRGMDESATVAASDDQDGEPLRFATPWQALGRKWHTVAKGFPQGTAPEWPLSLADKTLSVFEQLVGEESLTFDKPDRVTVRPAGTDSKWAEVITKSPDAVQVTLDGPPEAIDFKLLKRLEIDGPVSVGRSGSSQVTLNLTDMKHISSRRLQSFLKTHLAKSGVSPTGVSK